MIDNGASQTPQRKRQGNRSSIGWLRIFWGLVIMVFIIFAFIGANLAGIVPGPLPTLQPFMTPTHIPGLYVMVEVVEADKELEYLDDDPYLRQSGKRIVEGLLEDGKYVPKEWREPPPSAKLRFLVRFEVDKEFLQSCDYTSGGISSRLFRTQISFRIVILDLQTRETLAQRFFEGDEPSDCPFTKPFSGPVDILAGTPDYFTVTGWLGDTLIPIIAGAASKPIR